MRIVRLDSLEEKAMGLQYQPWIPDQTIFVFTDIYPGDTFHSMNVAEPFDIAFLDERHHVLLVRTMYPPEDEIHAPEGTVLAIETKGGRCGAWGILPGKRFALV